MTAQAHCFTTPLAGGMFRSPAAMKVAPSIALVSLPLHRLFDWHVSGVLGHKRSHMYL